MLGFVERSKRDFLFFFRRGGANDGFDVRLVEEVTASDFIDLRESEVGEDLRVFFRVIVAEADEFVDGRRVRKIIVGLVANGEGACEFFLGAIEFLLGKPIGGELADFVGESFFDIVEFGGVGADIEEEVAGCETDHVGSTDEVSEAHLFTDAVKETRTEVARSGGEDFEGDGIRRSDGCARIADEENGLFFIHIFGDGDGLGEGRGGRGILESEGAGGERREVFFDKGEGFLRIDIAEDSDDTILSHGELFMESDEVVAGDGGNAIRPAGGRPRVGVVTEEFLAKEVAGDRSDFVLLGFDRGELRVFFERDFLFWEARVFDNVG